MDSNDFELENKLRNLTLEQDDNVSRNEREHRLAALIATCVADIDPNDKPQELMSNEEKENNPENDQPTSLIVTNLPQSLFADPNLKMEFEKLFRTFDQSTSFHYLKSFRRARVDFSCSDITSKARVHLHQTPFGDVVMNCFFGQPPLTNKNTRQFLQIPPPVRQFLISPPASPPVGWAPAPESGPVVNFDLLAAIASLGPGDKHELLPASEGDKHELLPASEGQPGIVVHVCGDVEGVNKQQQQRIICQTPCPKRV
nr:EOG090X0FJX [Polyphemus pediculus]